MKPLAEMPPGGAGTVELNLNNRVS
jgi:hypothetical protein